MRSQARGWRIVKRSPADCAFSPMSPHEKKHDFPAIEIFSGLSAAEKSALAARVETLALAARRSPRPAGGCGRRPLRRRVGPLCGHARRPARRHQRDRPRPAHRRDRLSDGRQAHGDGYGHARRSRLASDAQASSTRLTSAHPAIWEALTATLAHRLTETTSALPARPDARPRTICLIRAGGAPVPEDFVKLLAEVFRAEARTLVVNSDNAARAAAGRRAARQRGSDAVAQCAREPLRPCPLRRRSRGDAVDGKGNPPRGSRARCRAVWRRPDAECARGARRRVRGARCAAARAGP